MRARIEKLIKEKFVELDNNEPVTEEVTDFLFWRDIRLRKIEDFMPIIKSMGGQIHSLTSSVECVILPRLPVLPIWLRIWLKGT